MATAVKSSIQVRVDEDLKKNAEQILDNIGLDLPTAMRVFLKKVVSSRSIPFKLEEESYYQFTPQEEEELVQAYEESFDPENTVAVTHTQEETQAYLDSLKN